MRAVIQKVTHADVTVEGNVTGAIGLGLMVLLGVSDADTDEDLDYMVRKITQLRIFEDDQDKMNLSVRDVGGAFLVISQFTLFANTKKGNRPSFIEAGAPEFSNKMYERFIERLRSMGFQTECGVFGAHMQVSLLNDGPVTIIMDSKNR